MNQVALVCPSEEAAQAIKKLLAGKEGMFDFNTLVPEPPEVLKTAKKGAKKGATMEELRAEYGSNNWYDWRLANWGTKWNAYDCELDASRIKQGILEYRFDTAWGPPAGVCRRLLDHITNHNLSIHVDWFYHEPMMGLQGQLEEEV
jgi:hypothetical protein